MNLELGKASTYDSHYNPEKLFAISRKTKRDEIGITNNVPFYGFDLWNHYEVSWLNEFGKPIVALAEIIYGCDTPCIIESKSMKLYFNSLNNSKFKDLTSLEKIIKKDLEECIGGPVSIKLTSLSESSDHIATTKFNGLCLDNLDITCDTFSVNPKYLQCEDTKVQETLYSNLLKSNCLVTGQPDWASIQIEYTGLKINHENLLKYLISYRNHNEFHEQCIERIFVDIKKHCQPDSLCIYARYTRRGGLDINPLRSTEKDLTKIKNTRLIRQ